MKNNRIRTLIERAADVAGIPESMTLDLVPIAVRHLQAAGRGSDPQHRDIVWAVDRARGEIGRRFLAALESRETQAA